MANPVFGMMQSLDGYVDGIKAEAQGDIASFVEASPATYVPDDRSSDRTSCHDDLAANSRACRRLPSPFLPLSPRR